MRLKMPGPNGIITLASDPDTALHAENKTAALALEALSEALSAEELTMLRSTVDKDDVILDKRSKSTFSNRQTKSSNSKSTQWTLQKQQLSGHSRTPQSTLHYGHSYARIGTSSPGTLQTCQESHAGWPSIA